MHNFLTWDYWQLVLLYMAWGLSKAAALLIVWWLVRRDLRFLCQQWHALRQQKQQEEMEQ